MMDRHVERERERLGHFSVHQRVCSGIHASQQITSPKIFYIWKFHHRPVRFYWFIYIYTNIICIHTYIHAYLLTYLYIYAASCCFLRRYALNCIRVIIHVCFHVYRGGCSLGKHTLKDITASSTWSKKKQQIQPSNYFQSPPLKPSVYHRFCVTQASFST